MNQFRPISPPEEAAAPRVTPVLLALALGGFAIGTTEFATMSLLPFFAPDLGVSEAQASHAISAYALGVVVGAPLLAVLGARMDRRRLLIGLMLMFAVGNLLSAMAANFGQMLLVRFLAGVPHGAYFGVAALMAASLVPIERRAQAMARVMLGLTIATIIGVPLANIIGQQFGWRWGFGLVTACALATAALIAWLAPSQPARAGQSPLTELGALANGQVWLTLSIGAIGFGGLFAVYTYLASTILDVTMAPPASILTWAQPDRIASSNPCSVLGKPPIARLVCVCRLSGTPSEHLALVPFIGDRYDSERIAGLRTNASIASSISTIYGRFKPRA